MKVYEKDRVLLNYPYTVTVQRSHKKGQYKNVRILCEDIFTFDIETTSFFYDTDLKPFLYKPGYDPEYWAGTYAGGLPYIWQFGINDTYYYGRDFDDEPMKLSDLEGEIGEVTVHGKIVEFDKRDIRNEGPQRGF